jgi:hypothetical protein
MRRLGFSEGFSLARIRLYVGLRQIFPYIFWGLSVSLHADTNPDKAFLENLDR